MLPYDWLCHYHRSQARQYDHRTNVLQQLQAFETWSTAALVLSAVALDFLATLSIISGTYEAFLQALQHDGAVSPNEPYDELPYCVTFDDP